jgi:Zn-dependent peptidase ImmA (M78 family)
MKRPKPFHLPVLFTEYLVKPRKTIKDASGCCNVTTREIFIASGTSAENWKATLWHEWVHAFFHEMGRPELCSDEALVEALAIGIMQVRSRAPDL